MNDIQRQKIKKTYREAASEKDAFLEAATEFGKFVAHGNLNGLPVEVAFEAAREHFKVYGKCMIDVANSVTLEMFRKT